jgi:hypothetical protein
MILGEGGETPFTALLVDHSERGLGLQSRAPLQTGTRVRLEPGEELLRAIGEIPAEGQVCWCRRTNAGLYRLGVQFHSAEQQHAQETPAAPSSVADYYEILQVHPKAEPETLHRVYRILAQRYHPDNRDTGNEERFKLVTRAYRVLSDPVERAGYDLQHKASMHARLRLFESIAESMGSEAERRKRYGVLGALYRKRQQDPHDPALSVFDLEDLLAVPREHLEFTFWYLRERGHVSRTDNNRYSITATGVDVFEQIEREMASSARLLPKPKAAGA